MNRYVVTYYTKTSRKIVSPELVSGLNRKELIEYVLKNIKEKMGIIMEIEGEWEVILTDNIESFKVTKY